MVTHVKTTVEVTDELLERAKEAARREGTTLRSLIEEGLRRVMDERQWPSRFELHDASVDGEGLAPEFRDGSWERIRQVSYGGRGG